MRDAQTPQQRSNIYVHISTGVFNGDTHMRKEYDSLIGFYRDFTGENKGCVTLTDIDDLIAKIKSETNAEVIELKGGGVVVQIPMPMSPKHLNQKKHVKFFYTKLSVAVRKEDAASFADACRKLGLKQADVIMPVVREIIALAEQKG
jgi:hypothetical protein